MPRSPSKITFTCVACSKNSTPRQIRNYFGRCRKCNQTTWNLTVAYIDQETKPSAVGLISLATVGVGWNTTKTYTNSRTFEGLSLETVQELIQDNMEQRIVEYIQNLEKADQVSRGAVPCHQCQVLFVPFEHKSWMQSGFCSIRCSEEAGFAVTTTAESELEKQKKNLSVIETTCPNGHKISVMRSFSGCIRPCPICGEKCAIP